MRCLLLFTQIPLTYAFISSACCKIFSTRIIKNETFCIPHSKLHKIIIIALGGKSPGIVVVLPRLSDRIRQVVATMFKSVYVIVPLLQYHILVIPTWITSLCTRSYSKLVASYGFVLELRKYIYF